MEKNGMENYIIKKGKYFKINLRIKIINNNY